MLDTNTCIRFINQRSESVIARFHVTSETDIVVCSVVRAELYFGARKSNDVQRTMTRQRAFAERYARIRAHPERAGTPIGGNDMLIAAIALANDLILVTHNTHEFSRIPGLVFEDWEAEAAPPDLP